MSRLTDNHFLGLEVEFDRNIENEELDFGGVYITHNKTDTAFALDIIQTYRNGTIVECEFQNIDDMLAGGYGIDNPMDITESELLLGDLYVEYFLGGETDAVPEKSTLFAKVGDTTIELDAIAD